MPHPETPASYRPDPKIASLADLIAFPVAAANFPQAVIRFRNDRAAATVGLDTLSDDQWCRHFGRFEPLPDNLPEPLALAYHGHQFRAYNPDIGDGRGFLFAQLRDARDRLLDLGTKGSGQTPFSRTADGRLTLKGGVREILATEMLEALGVDTSKTFSLIETGESLWRGDEPSPTRSAVLVRLSHGNLRIGTFQRLAAMDDAAGLARMVDYALDNFYDGARGANDAALLVEKVVAATARLAASYMAAGFVHGVLNSDNINITGESFDYGPWRWTPTWDPHFTAAYFDHQGLYAFARQAEAIHWNAAQLAISLRALSEAQPLIDALDSFAGQFEAALAAAVLWRLGFASQDPDSDGALVAAAETAMRTSGVQIDRFYFDWMGRPGDPPDGYDAPEFAEFRTLASTRQAARSRDLPYWRGDAPCTMHVGEVEAIWEAIAERDDWQPLDAKIAAIRAMGVALGTQG